MSTRKSAVVMFLTLATVVAGGAPEVWAQVEGAPVSAVPQIYTINGQYSRIAYNNEGWVTLGFRQANLSQGSEWMLLEAGVTIRKPHKNQKMTRTNFSVKLPDGTMVPMATQNEIVKAGYLRALNTVADTFRDSINYFPIEARQGCAMRFFSDPTNADSISYDQFELSFQRACMGRIFFKMPEGTTIEPGQYWLSVNFEGSTVEAPFRIMTKDEEKFLRKNWKDLKKEHEAFLKAEAEKAKAMLEQQQ